MKTKRIWIVYCSRKGGHTYPVNALYNYINDNYTTQLEPHVLNFLDYAPIVSLFEKIGRYGDLKLRRLWKLGYNNLKDENPVLLKPWRWLEGLLFSIDGIKDKLISEAGQPDIIISFQPEVNAIAPLLKKWYGVPIHTSVVDLAMHGLWVNEQIDNYYLFNDMLGQDIQKYGVPTSKITVSGITLRPNFSKIVYSEKRAIRKKIGIAENLPTLLLIGGLLGKMVDYLTVMQSIMEQDFSCQLMVVFGKNDESRKIGLKLKEKVKNPIYIYGTVDNMEEMMWASDLVISKPGSVTMAESLALGRPMVVITPQAGSAQELRFAHFLKQSGAGEWVETSEAVGPVTKEILLNLNLLNRMQENAQKIGSKSLDANKIITENIIKVLSY